MPGARTRVERLTPIKSAISSSVCSLLLLGPVRLAAWRESWRPAEAADPASSLGGRHPSPRAFDDNFPLELRECRKDVETRRPPDVVVSIPS